MGFYQQIFFLCCMEQNNRNEIILYKLDGTLSLEVWVYNETVWLTQAQMMDLFQTSKQNISLHINNIFKEKELDKDSVVKESLTTATDGKSYHTNYYNLDVIISVGYRVKSVRGTQFRQWANKVLKEYLLRGYAINQRLDYHSHLISDLRNDVDILIKTSLPPREGIFFNGQIFDAYVFVSKLIKIATTRIVLIDNYVDETVLTMLDKRTPGVKALIYTQNISRKLQLDIDRHNSQYAPIAVNVVPNIHDRFIIIDKELYHIGASIKDLGKKLFAFSRMEIAPDIILNSLYTD